MRSTDAISVSQSSAESTARLLPDGFRLLLPTAEPEVTPALPAIVQAALDGAPWTFPPNPKGEVWPQVPSYPIRQKDLTVRQAEVAGEMRRLLELPGPVANALAMAEKLPRFDRSFPAFLSQYVDQVAEELARDLKTLFRSGKFPGGQFHLDADPRITDSHTWGLASRDLDVLKEAELLIEGPHGWLLRCAAWVERHPVTGPLAIHPVHRLVELPDRVPGHLYGQARAVKLCLAGDVDGDGVSLVLVPRRRAELPVRPAAEFPSVTLVGDPSALLAQLRAWRPADPEAGADKVVGMMVRTELTGLLTYAFHRAVRCYAVGKARVSEQPQPAFREAYRQGFLPFTPVSEGVFDGWKAKPRAGETKAEAQDRALRDLCAAADALERWVGGQSTPEALQTALAPFQEPETAGILAELLEASADLSVGERTAAGKLLAAGSKNLPVVGRAVQELARMAPEGALRWLLDDLHGRQAAPIVFTERKERDPQAQPFFLHPEAKGAAAVLDALHYRLPDGRSRPVAPRVTVHTVRPEGEEPRTILKAGIAPWWLWPESEQPRFLWSLELELPVSAKLTFEGHQSVRWAGCAFEWLYRPQVVVEPDGELRDRKLREFLSQTLLTALEAVSRNQQRARPTAGKLVQKELQQALRTAVASLASIENAGDREVYAGELQIIYPEDVSVSEKLRIARTALRKMARLGMDVLTTSKSEPGCIVSLPGTSDRYGVPDWAAAPFPLERYGQAGPKRRAENRGLREALALHAPTPREKLLTWSDLTLPEWQEGRLKLCRVIFANLPGINEWTEPDGSTDHFDTLTATYAGLQATAIRETTEWIMEEEVLERTLQRYRDRGIPEHCLSVEKVASHVAEGVQTVRWQLKVTYPHGLVDPGKKKSCPPVKGVPFVLPRELGLHTNGAPVDFVISLRTLGDKEGWNALLLAALYEAGLTSLDPAWELEDLMERACWELQPVTLTGPEGERVIGQALAGWLPFYVAPETTHRTARFRKVKVEYHSQIMAGIDPMHTPGWAAQAQQFDARMQLLQQLQQQLGPLQGDRSRR